MKLKYDLIDIKELENKLFISLNNWNNEGYMSRLKLCDKHKLRNKIDSLNFQYSVFLLNKE